MFFKKESASVSSAIDSFFSIPHNCIQGGPLLTGGIIVNVGGQSGHRFAVKQEVVHPVLSRNILQQKKKNSENFGTLYSNKKNAENFVTVIVSNILCVRN